MGTRLQALENDGQIPEFPAKGAFPNLFNLLLDIGPVMHTGMGGVPLTHSEIRAWKENMRIELTAWEAQTLRSLSWAYLSASQAAEEPDCPAFWAPEISPEDQALQRLNTGKKITGVFRMLMTTRPRK